MFLFRNHQGTCKIPLYPWKLPLYLGEAYFIMMKSRMSSLLWYNEKIYFLPPYFLSPYFFLLSSSFLLLTLASSVYLSNFLSSFLFTFRLSLSFQLLSIVLLVFYAILWLVVAVLTLPSLFLFPSIIIPSLCLSLQRAVESAWLPGRPYYRTVCAVCPVRASSRTLLSPWPERHG